jgi:hypothetical protein
LTATSLTFCATWTCRACGKAKPLHSVGTKKQF